MTVLACNWIFFKYFFSFVELTLYKSQTFTKHTGGLQTLHITADEDSIEWLHKFSITLEVRTENCKP